MNDFYADKRYYLDFSTIVLLESIGTNARQVVVTLINGNMYHFYENAEQDYKIYTALKAWHNEKIKETK